MYFYSLTKSLWLYKWWRKAVHNAPISYKTGKDYADMVKSSRWSQEIKKVNRIPPFGVATHQNMNDMLHSWA